MARRRLSAKLSPKKVGDIIEMEGLSYAIQHYISADQIANPELRKAWQDAKQALDAIEYIIGEAEKVERQCAIS